MTIHKCDKCGKEMNVWMTFIVNIDTERPETNVANLLPLKGVKEFCPACCKEMGLIKEVKT